MIIIDIGDTKQNASITTIDAEQRPYFGFAMSWQIDESKITKHLKKDEPLFDEVCKFYSELQRLNEKLAEIKEENA